MHSKTGHTVKSKFHPITCHEGTESKRELCSLTLVLDEFRWLMSRPSHLPPRMTQHLLYKRLGGALGLVWTGAENIDTPGFNPWTSSL
jgi:hypothetical protein